MISNILKYLKIFSKYFLIFLIFIMFILIFIKYYLLSVLINNLNFFGQILDH